ALAAAVSRRASWRDRLVALAAVVFFLIAMNWTPLAHMLNALPPFSFTANDKLRFVTLFFGVVLAAKWLDRVRDEPLWPAAVIGIALIAVDLYVYKKQRALMQPVDLVGLVATLVTWALGFPTPLLWGALAFVLNYIPYVGPGIMHVILFVIGLLTFDTLWPALIAPLFFMAFTFVEGHFIVPNVIGRQLLLHPLAVFLSLAFWAWLWGPIGALLATPILIVAMVSIDHLYPRGTKMLPG
ncbi:MAG: AI-2E family transporter, partial [Pseudorhodoplanes sp.]